MNEDTPLPLPPPRGFRLRCPLPAPRVRGRTLVVYNRRDSLWGLTKVQGLFSEFYAVLGALRYAEQHDAAAVRVRFDSPLYLDPVRGPNWWAYFFAEEMPLRAAAATAHAVHARGWQRFGPHAWNDSWTSEIIPRNSSRQPYPLDSAAELHEAARLTRRYIRVHPEWQARADAFMTARCEPGDFVIGLHFRGTDKALAYPYRSPAFATYEREVDRILAERRPARHRIFVATDQAEFADWARERYGGRMFLQEDAPRLPAGDALGRLGGTHKHPAIPAGLKGDAAVLKCLLLARCHHLVKNRSSLSDAALAFNPRLPWTFILSDEEVTRHPPVWPAAAAITPTPPSVRPRLP